MERNETPITSSFLGLVKRGNCPLCGGPVSVNFGFKDMLLCPKCGDYLEVADKKLRQMDVSVVKPQPAFAAPTPWTDMQAPRFPTISLASSAEDYLKEALLDLVTTKKGSVRIFEAKWPVGCCVCGKPATREETVFERFIFTPPRPGIVHFIDKDNEATVVAKGVPHCSEHKQGARFERAIFSTSAQETVVGLLFRSYAYQIQFRKLNPWKWV